eukprot:g43012.t1
MSNHPQPTRDARACSLARCHSFGLGEKRFVCDGSAARRYLCYWRGGLLIDGDGLVARLRRWSIRSTCWEHHGAFGGHLNSVQAFDTETKRWTAVAPMAWKRCRCEAAMLEEHHMSSMVECGIETLKCAWVTPCQRILLAERTIIHRKGDFKPRLPGQLPPLSSVQPRPGPSECR